MFTLLRLLPAIFLITTFSSLKAQVGKESSGTYSKARVYISIDKPVRGQAQEDKKIFIDSDKGSYAYIIVDNYPNKFPTKSIKLTSFKKVGGQYEKLNSESYDIDNAFTYTYIKYSFNTTGEYAFDVHDANGDFINSGFVTAETNEKTSTGGSGNYSRSKAFVSTEVPVSGVAKEAKTILINRSQGSYAYIVLDNYPTNLNVKQIKLKAYKKVNGKFEKLDEKTYDINPDNYYTYIKYNFFAAGDFAFDIYDINNQFINTAYITVEYK